MKPPYNGDVFFFLSKGLLFFRRHIKVTRQLGTSTIKKYPTYSSIDRFGSSRLPVLFFLWRISRQLDLPFDITSIDRRPLKCHWFIACLFSHCVPDDLQQHDERAIYEVDVNRNVRATTLRDILSEFPRAQETNEKVLQRERSREIKIKPLDRFNHKILILSNQYVLLTVSSIIISTNKCSIFL